MLRFVALSMALGTLASGGVAQAEPPACSNGVIPVIVYGSATFATCNSEALGGKTTFAYYVPAACSEEAHCPVLYLLHGFGGDRSSMLRPGGTPTSWLRALTEDPVTGADLPDLPFIVVAPEGRTVPTSLPGAPAPGLESFWVDWNPRYWQNPPRFEAFVVDELVGLVDRSFPTIVNREGRAIEGVSLGGFGSFKLALQHPDLFASAGSVSGALNILVAPAVQPVPPDTTPDPRIRPQWPYQPAPRIAQTPPGFPFGDPFGAFGDPVADEAYFRGNNPLDLALNARGLPLRFVHNDTVPRDPTDAGNPPSYVGAQALESVVLPMNVEMRAALTHHGNSDFVHEIHPGLHSDRYWDPHIRAQLEWHWSRVSHPRESPLPAAIPSRFDHRSIRDAFSVWGWDVEVEDRDPEEFLTLWSASTRGVTIVGSGRITITTPPWDVTDVFVSGVPREDVQVEIDAAGRAKVTFPWLADAITDEHGGSVGVGKAPKHVRLCLEIAGRPAQC